MGNSADNPKLALSSFDNELWGYLMKAVGTSSSVEHINNIPSQFKLEQNYPNPFNPSTTIEYTIPRNPSISPLYRRGDEGGFVTLKVYDILGREVVTLVNEYQQPWKYKVKFDVETRRSAGESLPNGVYFYQLKITDSSLRSEYKVTKKMVLLK